MEVTKEVIVKTLKKDIQNINQLCDMVNTYSEKLGLGKKVHAEDFTENAEKALKQLNQ